MKTRDVMQLDHLDEVASLAERAYLRLRAEILQGDLPPGVPLRPADLQARLRFGLTPIREALMRLASEGLVETVTHRGARVTGISLDSFCDLMQTRREIEALCLSRAIVQGDAVWEAEIVASMHLLSRTPLPHPGGDPARSSEWERCHRRFHYSLVSACGSEWLMRFWNTLMDHSERYRAIRAIRHREAAAEVRDFDAEHREIMRAVLDRDLLRAQSLMDSHLRATQTAISRLLAPEAAAGWGDRCGA